LKLSQDEIEQILNILNSRNITFIASTLGTQYLSEDEKKSLEGLGFDLDKIYNEAKDPLLLNFQLGMLSSFLDQRDLNKIAFSDLTQMIKQGNYIPLNKRELATLDSVKRQSLSDIRANNGRIFSDINGIIVKEEQNNRDAYEKVIRNEISEGLAKRESNAKIARELARKTGDWSRNFNRIVQYVSHQAFDEGRAASFKRKEEDPQVYKRVFSGACKHCVRLYLTNGVGSQPVVFKLSDLEANGNNIGRKVDEWLPVLGSSHPFCRCMLVHIKRGSKWNEEKQDFIRTFEDEKPLGIRIEINGKKHTI